MMKIKKQKAQKSLSQKEKLNFKMIKTVQNQLKSRIKQTILKKIKLMQKALKKIIKNS